MAIQHDDQGVQITGTIQTEGVTMDGHTHESGAKLSGSDAQLDRSGPPDMAYTEKQLINLINMMRYAMTSGHNELPTIAKASKHAYPEFAKALEEFSEEARLQIQDWLRGSERLELIERLYRAEQMKTEALAEYSKF
ncbi:hypothetical protein AAM37_gp61 [Pantoea phage vB_PagM_AAM37]|uniref:Uncharacterized protein n=1 Tax=Pantoea phage vB_PagM_AAM37 TaxID=2588093 RepID=A0A513ZYJ4_9CAUD|nr:hypothetical protein HWC22_gp61 [Pantoea phage vB_PagM_AAM37]QDH45732.1 hypothetical protein AAM37_gp61 [Pantoea phage vB_PagM_AAM37]